MKPVYYIFLILLTSIYACETKKQSTTQVSDSIAAPNSVANDTPVRMTDRLTRLGLTASSHWRGLNLGDDVNLIKTTEKGEPFEQDTQHVGYAIDFPNLESMDVLYGQQNEKISAITADLYLNNRAAAEAYQKELLDYFTARYGAPKTANGGQVWQGPVAEEITLKDVSKGKDYGLKVSVRSKSSEMASAK